MTLDQPSEARAHDYPVLITPLSSEDGGGYLATVPDLPGCMSDGATLEEAAHNVDLAILEWIDEARRLGREIPLPAVQSPA
jgi:predicted RNase H-like HicB family nuclease